MTAGVEQLPHRPMMRGLLAPRDIKSVIAECLAARPRNFELYQSRVKVSKLSRGVWRSALSAIQNAFDEQKPAGVGLAEWTEDKARWLKVLLNQGTDVERRARLDWEIQTIVQEEDLDPGQDPDVDAAKSRFISMLELLEDLVESRHPDTGRNVFHEAASRGSVYAIREFHRVLTTKYASMDIALRQQYISDMILAEDSAGIGSRTPLFLAVENKSVKTVQALISLCVLNQPSPRFKASLVKAVELKALEILQTLLTDSAAASQDATPPTAAPTVRYRTGYIQLDLFEQAVKSYHEIILDFLFDHFEGDLRMCHDCNFLHDAVKANKVEAVRHLLQRVPELAARFRRETETTADGPKYVRRPVLDYVDLTTDAGSQVWELVLPCLLKLRDLNVSILRDHIPHAYRNEFYLDLSFLAADPSAFRSFLAQVHRDLREATNDALDNPQTFMALLHQQNANLALQQGIRPFFTAAEPGRVRDPAGLDINFERILKYVEIPAFESDRSDEPSVDACCILYWLRFCKGVHTILELRFKDSLHKPHREEHIEHTLAGFGVRDLDWRRTDLSILAVKECASDVESLSLYSSGDLGVIDHWIGPRGVVTLEKLQTLRISLIEDNISKERGDRCCELLKEGLQGNFKGDLQLVRLPWSKLETSYQGGGQRQQQARNNPVQVTQLGRFLKRYKDFQNNWMRPRNEKTKTAKSSRTKVAILDTGINKDLFSGSGHRVVGRSFAYRGTGSDQRECPWWLATDSHGSAVANIISHLDPCCDLYIAQVSEDKQSISREAVCRAFKWAIQEKVQIINCSFALYEPHQPLVQLINEALHQGIVVVCSTSDEGFTRQNVWPARYSSYSNVVPVAACDANGKLTAYSSEIAAQYRIQGEQIAVSSPDDKLGSKLNTESGSSVATAMVSGIASLVLACQHILDSTLANAMNGPFQQPGYQVVRHVFEKMVSQSPPNSGPPLVQPWLAFPFREGDFGLARNSEFEAWIRDEFLQSPKLQGETP